jgi:hypothetical protein
LTALAALYFQVQTKVEELLGGEKLDAIICVAGGWAGGSASSKSKLEFLAANF